MNTQCKIGVISDTHGLLRPEAIQILQDVNLILHAGDIGKKIILDELNKIAPVIAIKGNVDKEEWAIDLPKTKQIEVLSHKLYVIHNLKELNLNPKEEGIDLIISGHSHKPSENMIQGVTYLNPGSIGPKRFNMPISMALITIEDRSISIQKKEIVTDY